MTDPARLDGPEPPPWDALEDPEPRTRSRRLLLLGVIPWGVVAVLVVRTFAGPSSGPVAATGPTAAPSPSSTPTARSKPSVTPGEGTVALRFGSRVAPGPDDAAAVGLVVARAWLGEIGPEPSVEVGAADGTPVYVEHLAVEAVDVPTPDTAVVTVLAVVMETDGDAYTSARVVRAGVPVALDASGAYPAGDPWWLPAPDLSARPPAWTPVDDPDALARAGSALEAAGYRQVSVRELATSPSWPLRVTADAVAPGAPGSAEHTVWLRDHLGELVVAGVLPPRQEDRP